MARKHSHCRVKLRAHLADALSYAGKISHPHSNNNFLPGIRTRDPQSQAGWDLEEQHKGGVWEDRQREQDKVRSGTRQKRAAKGHTERCRT